jgi:endonuclease YncB( thermonuclease family)
MRYITLLLISFLLTTSAHTQESNEGSIITGRAAVLEGDTIEINGQKIRLHGIDAPQHRQTCHDRRGLLYRCGLKSKTALDLFLWRNEITCHILTSDKYGRKLANCSLGQVDVADWLVRQGHAVAFKKYSYEPLAKLLRFLRDQKAL